MNWIKNSDDDYSRVIGRLKTGILSCTKHCILGDTWWEIQYKDRYITEYTETYEDEIDYNDTEKVLEYANKWLSELIENISNKYNKLREDGI